MGDIKIIRYCVCGVKSLDKEIELSFYKKTIRRPVDFSNYNIKAIYGMNGTGKTAIISSIDILKNILLDENYLGNSFVQKKLKELINKRTKKCNFTVDFVVDYTDKKALKYYRYKVDLEEKQGRFYIARENLSGRKSLAGKEEFEVLLDVENGTILFAKDSYSDFEKEFIENSKNLLTNSSACSLMPRLLVNYDRDRLIDLMSDEMFFALLTLLLFASSISVYMDIEDEHTEFLFDDFMDRLNAEDESFPVMERILKEAYSYNKTRIDQLGSKKTFVHKDEFSKYKGLISQLETFLKVFKNDLKRIKIEKQDDKDYYVCNLLLEYNNYSVDAEFESTGIKKLIRLFSNLRDMYNGKIVFVDEMDSNIHDVYLCAILEFLSEYGEGQLCFTSHSIGPMDVLKKKKKSIDFLSVNNTITSWTTSGNYSPGSLYRKGMVEGSPFNIEAIDFLGVFDQI